MSDTESPAWRVGRKVGRTLYREEKLVGVMDTPELANEVVAAVNSAPPAEVPPKEQSEIAKFRAFKRNEAVDLRARSTETKAATVETNRGDILMAVTRPLPVDDMPDPDSNAVTERDTLRALKENLEDLLRKREAEIRGRRENTHRDECHEHDALKRELEEARKHVSALQAELKASDARLERLVQTIDAKADALGVPRSICPECGPNVGLDEDGCCASCGCNAMASPEARQLIGNIVDEAIARARAEEREECAQIVEYAIGGQLVGPGATRGTLYRIVDRLRARSTEADKEKP